MIKLTSDIQREILMFLFGPETAEDLSDSLTVSYTKRIRNIVEKKGYMIVENNANINIMKDRNYSTVLEITTSGEDERGRFISISMESFEGSPFENMTIFDENWEEVETIEV